MWGGSEGLDNSWLVVVNSVDGAGAKLMETAEECGVGSESSSEPGAQISLVETVINSDWRVVVEGADNSWTMVKTVDSHRGGVKTVDSHWGGVESGDSGGGVVGDHSSSHDLGGGSQGRRGEHRQGKHQETGLRCRHEVSRKVLYCKIFFCLRGHLRIAYFEEFHD